MFGLFEMKYMNICLVAGVILELIALVAILNLYINIRRRERRQKNREDGAGLYDRAVCAGTDEALKLPLYVFAIPCLWRYCPYWFCDFSIISIFVYKDLR